MRNGFGWTAATVVVGGGVELPRPAIFTIAKTMSDGEHDAADRAESPRAGCGLATLAEAVAPASAASRRGGARPREVAREEMRGRARILGGFRRRLLREIGREALVEEDDRHLEALAQRRRELLGDRAPAGRARRASVSGCPTTTCSGCSSATRRSSSARPSSDAARSTTHSGRAITPVGSETATPVRALPKSSAITFMRAPPRRPSCRPRARRELRAGFLPPASASVGLPPPPPPMCLPRSRTSCVASRPALRRATRRS